MPFFFSLKSALSKSVQTIALLCATVLLLIFMYTSSIRVVVEDAIFFVAPTPERAYHYGTIHFDASDARMYDIRRAERFFLASERLNPNQPYVQHQLARIAFLRGDFFLALTRINKELENPTPAPSAYYIRGLIKGYMDDFGGAIEDYEIYVAQNPTNWAATNDLAWVLLKANRPQEALIAINKVLPLWPNNAWLLNNKSIALTELGKTHEAYESAKAAEQAIEGVSESDWSYAYPGNDPLVAHDGLMSFKKAVSDNVHSIELALEKEKKDVQ